MNSSRLTRSVCSFVLLTAGAVAFAQPPFGSLEALTAPNSTASRQRSPSALPDASSEHDAAMFPLSPRESSPVLQSPVLQSPPQTGSANSFRPGLVEPDGFGGLSSPEWPRLEQQTRKPRVNDPRFVDPRAANRRLAVEPEPPNWSAATAGREPAMFPAPAAGLPGMSSAVALPESESKQNRYQSAPDSDPLRARIAPPQWPVQEPVGQASSRPGGRTVANDQSRLDQQPSGRAVAEFPAPTPSNTAAGPLDLPLPQLQSPDAAILSPLLQSPEGGPIVFQGIEPLPVDDEYATFATFPDGRAQYPILPQLDPALENAGNGDGQLDWIDLIEEYAGRATRSDMPAEPHRTHPDQRSWLRIDHWDAEASFLPAGTKRFGLLTGYGSMTIGLPKIRGVTVKPAFAYRMVDGPTSLAIPNTLYDASVEAAWMTQVEDRWRMRLAATGGVYTDNGKASWLDSTRISGMWLFSYEWQPDLQLVAGSWIVNLDDRLVLPIAGVVYQPDDDRRYELVFPEGKVAQKFATEERKERTRWLYLSWGFFGRTWRVDRPNGQTDRLTYSDWRVAAGLENKSLFSGITSFAEVGVSFARDVRFGFSPGDYHPGTVGFVRGGINF